MVRAGWAGGGGIFGFVFFQGRAIAVARRPALGAPSKCTCDPIVPFGERGAGFGRSLGAFGRSLGGGRRSLPPPSPNKLPGRVRLTRRASTSSVNIAEWNLRVLVAPTAFSGVAESICIKPLFVFFCSRVCGVEPWTPALILRLQLHIGSGTKNTRSHRALPPVRSATARGATHAPTPHRMPARPMQARTALGWPVELKRHVVDKCLSKLGGPGAFLGVRRGHLRKNTGIFGVFWGATLRDNERLCGAELPTRDQCCNDVHACQSASRSDVSERS